MTASTKTASTQPVVLKSLHNDIMKANPSSDLTTKKMRVVLRQKMNDVHARNSSWVFNPTDYDRARSLFDPAYAKKIERASKPKSPRKSKPAAAPATNAE